MYLLNIPGDMTEKLMERWVFLLVKLNREFGKVKKYLLSWADLDFADLSLYFANNESIKAYFLDTVVGVQIQFGAHFYRCLSLFISPSI